MTNAHAVNKREKWIAAIETHQKFDYNVAVFSVCEQHFPAYMIIRRGKTSVLKKDAVPSIFTEHQLHEHKELQIVKVVSIALEKKIADLLQKRK